MNLRILTGYLPADGAVAYAPATAEHGPLPRLVFEVMLRDSQGIEFPDRCVVEAAERIREYQPLLTAGRAVIVQGEQTGRQYVDRHGVKGNWIREVRVHAMEFPNRGGKKQSDDKAE